MKLICVKCQRLYRIKKGGTFIEMMLKDDSHSPQPGTAEPDQWQLYKLWMMGDLWQCQGCGHETISGVAFQAEIERLRAALGEAITELEDGEHHDDGAFDSECPRCILLNKLRALAG